MVFYKVKFKVNQRNEYIYPKSVEKTVWKSTIYHSTEKIMIGETDAKIKVDGKNVVALKRTEAKKMIAKFQSSYPKISEMEENIF